MFELYAYDARTGKMRRATNRPSGTFYGIISPDGSHIYYVNDKEGNETGHIVRVPFEEISNSPQDMTPTMPEYTLVQPYVDGTSSHLGLTVPGSEGFDSFIVKLSGNSVDGPRLIRRGKKASDGPMFSHDGSTSVIWSADRFGGLDFTLIAFDTKSGRQLSELADDSSRIEPSAFSPINGDQRILATSNVTGMMRPLVWDPTKDTRNDLNLPGLEGEVVGLGWSPNAKQALLSQTYKATTTLWTYDLESRKTTRVLHPEGYISAAQFQTNDVILFAWQDSVNPTQLMTIDMGERRPHPRSLLGPKNVPKSRPWRSISFQSSDGQLIQAWLATPEGLGPFPTILDTHGGPTWAQFNMFHPRGQVWLDHGFAFLSVNYRVSTTFGKEFEKKINGDLGHWEVEDMVAGRQWLVDNGIAKPDQIFLTGWSYGGYLTLQAIGLHPKLWAGGMGGVVVADWVSQYEDEPEAMRGYDVALMEGTLEEKMSTYIKSSPLTYIDRLTAPVLIIQGKNDVRDPPRQVELYEAKAKALGKNVEVVWFETGHAGSGLDIDLVISHHETMLRWIFKVLGSKKLLPARPLTATTA